MQDESDTEFGAHKRSLSDAVRHARRDLVANRTAQDNGPEADLALLDRLYEELEEVFDEARRCGPHFICTLSDAAPPRLWLDVITYVEVDPNSGRLILFQDEGRKSRIMLESDDVEQMADSITDYLADKVLEREDQVSDLKPSLSWDKIRRALAIFCGGGVIGYLMGLIHS